MASQPPNQTPTPAPSKEEHEAATKALNTLLTNHATTTSSASQPQTPTHASPTTKSYLSYLALPQQASLEAFENSWHLGNYVLDRHSGAKTFEPMSIYVRLGMHFLYYGTGQEAVLHWKASQNLLRHQTEALGKTYDSPASTRHIRPFIESFGLKESLGELAQPDPDKYATFNEFFARELRSGVRPVDGEEDPRVVSSIADCRLIVFGTVGLAVKYWVKGFGFTIGRLLGEEKDGDGKGGHPEREKEKERETRSKWATSFEFGSIAISRLAPQDYHRWHSPIDGVIESITEIPGTYYTVNPQAINEAGVLNVFCENRRSVMIVRRKVGPSQPPTSIVAIVAVGAMLVGSIRYDPGIVVGAEIKRGQCLGAFQYGGSTVIALFPKGEVVFDEDLIANSTEKCCETLVKVGWRIGRGPVEKTIEWQKTPVRIS
jgi:phosphatidylserine decarboxylase